MKYYLFILTLLLLSSCNDKIGSKKNMTSKDSLILSIQGSWKGFKGEPIWYIQTDSIFYYSENKNYYYFIHDNDMFVLYKNGPYRIKNIGVTNDTLFFKIGDLNAKAFKSEIRNPIKINDNYSKNHPEDEIAHDSTQNKILGEWGYETNEGVFASVVGTSPINENPFLPWSGVPTIVVNLREKALIKLMRKSSLRSSDRFQFSPHNIYKSSWV